MNTFWVDALLLLLAESWHVFRQAAPFLLFGFFVAGLLKALVPSDLLVRHFGGRGFASVLKGALLGAPLPLCSCGVLPAAMGLRRQGAGAGATTAFMIATPETGVDSMAVTYALIDPLMTVLRPISAVLTALVAGLASNLLPERLVPVMAPAHKAEPSGCVTGCAPGSTSGCCSTALPHGPATQAGLSLRLRQGLGHAFGEMLADVGVWLVIGVLAAGAISAFVPPTFFMNSLGGELTSMLAMLLVGLPMYVCASSSTPIAASLLLKGLSPGAALVFLLTGPATNVTTLTVMARTFGAALTGVYVASIAICSVAFGLIANRIYAALGFDIHAVLGSVAETLPAWVEIASSVLLVVLILRALYTSRHTHEACGEGVTSH